jgi:hypothetical protein
LECVAPSLNSEAGVLLNVGFFPAQGIYGAIWAKLNIAWSKRIRAGTWVKRHPVVEVLMVRHHSAGKLIEHSL